MARQIRNLEGVQFEALRRVIDQPFHDFKDELEESYYGDRQADGSTDKCTGWIAGISKPFRGVDKQATPEDSQKLFDEIHGHLFTLYTLVLHDENVAQGLPFAREEIDRPVASRVAEGIIETARSERRVLTGQEKTEINASLIDASPNTTIELKRARMRALRTSNVAVFDLLKTWATEQGFDLDPDRTD